MKMMAVFLATWFPLHCFAADKAHSFSKNQIAALAQKQVFDVFCTPSKSQELTYKLQKACSAASAAEIDLKWFSPKIEMTSLSSIRIFGNKLSLEISRTNDSQIFTVNRKKIDVREYPDFLSLKSAIQSRMPKYSLLGFLLPEAYGADVRGYSEISIDQLSTLASLLLEATSDADICADAYKLAIACKQFPGHVAGKDILPMAQVTLAIVNRINRDSAVSSDPEVKKMTPREKTVLNLSITSFTSDLTILKSDLSDLDDKEPNLTKCPAVEKAANQNAWTDLTACEDSLKKIEDQFDALVTPKSKALTDVASDFATIVKVKNLLNSSTSSGGPNSSQAR